jgi:aminopeptidase N
VFHWKQEQPHVAYLVMVAIGRYAVVKDEWRGKPVLYYVPPARKADIERTFGRTKEMLDFFSGRFGIDYPWDKYAQVVVEQFNAGGMENTSATTLNDRALHDARASLDSDADGLIAHELGHQWWGDLVTCKDWSHLWLNEGFASYCEVLWDEHRRGPDHAAVNLLNKAKAAMAGGKDRPVVDRRYTSPGAMFDARVYPKGAWVLHMLRRRLGDDAFFRCIRRWGTEYRLRTADTDDFRKVLEAETGRSLERFFYDFTERPGHPVVEVGVEWLAESKLVKVTAKQTQAGEAFEIPLVVEFRCGGGDSARTVTLRETMADKEARFFLPLPDRPAMVRVDPEQSVLAEWKESKGRDLWLAQLHDDPHPVQRIRAARHFGESKSPADREALAKALAREGFFGVAAEIAAALGESGGDTCRDALLAGLKHEHPKVRRACAAEMGKFPREPAVTDVLRALLDKGDASYFVEAAAAESYGKARAADAVSVLTPLLDRPSHNEVIRSAALSGLAEAGDVTALSTLLAWTARGKPRPVRIAALRAVDRLMTIGNPDDDSRKAAVAAVTRCLESDSRPVRQAAAETLRGLGRSAAPALPVLEAIARHDPDDRVRELAGRAAERVRSDSPAPVELSRLREELDRLRKANEALAEKVERIERK